MTVLRPLQAVAVLVLTLALTACATGPSARSGVGADPATVLEARAMERWKLLLDGEFGQAYSFLTEGYRGTRSEAEYTALMRSRLNIRWLSASWNGVECEREDSCLVSVLVNYEVRMPQVGAVASVHESSERWLRQGGQWRHLPSE